jgi:hypothetical protein
MSKDIVKVLFNVEKDTGHRIETSLEEKELAAIGYVTVQWAYLEHIILVHTLRIAHQNNVPVPVDARSKSFENRRNAWRKLIKESVTDASERTALLKIVSKIANLELKRHRLTHGLWGWDEEDPTTMRAYSFRPRVEFDVDFDFDGLMELGFQIGEINFQLTFPRGKKEAWEAVWEAVGEANESDGSFTYIDRSWLRSVMVKNAMPKRRPRQGNPRKHKRG